jgi:hypothetical protein
MNGGTVDRAANKNENTYLLFAMMNPSSTSLAPPAAATDDDDYHYNRHFFNHPRREL